MAKEIIKVPDIGGSDNVDVIEVSVSVGDEIAVDDAILVLESDKASMDVPSPVAGKVVSLSVKEGDKVSEGDAILEVEVEVAGGEASGNGGAAQKASEPAAPAEAQAETAAAQTSSVSELPVAVPDIGGADAVDVIEVSVAVGDEVAEGDTLIVLESDKASMDIPSPAAGKVLSFAVSEGDKVGQGTAICVLSAEGAAPAAEPAQTSTHETQAKAEPEKAAAPQPTAEVHQRTSEKFYSEPESAGSSVYAGPASRKLAREMGVDLSQVAGSGPKGRVSQDDIKAYVKKVMQSGGAAASGGSGIPSIPEIDFAKFGEVEIVKMDKIKKLTTDAMSLNWLNVPRVTQFDDADITEMEAFRKGMKAEAEKAGVKLTPVPFLLKAVAAALKANPNFNVAVTSDLQHIVRKKYINISLAVDTPRGLMVPVIKDVDKKGLFELAAEVIELAGKARDGKLKPAEMQGGCFTISSLGALGGTGFTPIVSTHEAGILGVSKATMKPVWDGKEFQPRLMLPLSLSYDHKAVNGSDAGQFLTYLVNVIGDIRKLLL